MILLKYLKTQIAVPLEIIFNKSMTEGIVPHQLKVAHIVPIFKGNGKHELIDFRPISLLNCLSKVSEKIMHMRVYKFINKKNLFSNTQYSFRE